MLRRRGELDAGPSDWGRRDQLLLHLLDKSGLNIPINACTRACELYLKPAVVGPSPGLPPWSALLDKPLDGSRSEMQGIAAKAPALDLYEIFMNSLGTIYGQSDRMKWAENREARNSARQLMNILFLMVCGMSLAFFGYFFLACHLDAFRRKPRRSSVVKVSPEIQAIDSPVGRHSFVHLEKQMADFLTHHRSAGTAERT